jgi:hypothetical protein
MVLRVTPLEAIKLFIWLLLGFGAWLVYSGLESIIHLQPIPSILTGVFVLLGVAFLFKMRMIPFA